MTREATDRPGNHPHVEEERDELAGSGLPLGDLMAAVPEHDDRRGEGEEPDEREHRGADPRTLDRLGEGEGELLVEAGGLVVLAGERLHDPHLGDRLLEDPDGLALRVLRLTRDRADPVPHALAEDADGRGDDERQERELPVHDEDDREATDELEHLTEHGEDRLRDHAMDDGRVARHMGHELARLPVVKEREGKRLEMPDDRHPEIEDDLLPGPGHDELTNAVHDRAHEKDDDETRNERVEKAGVLQTEIEDALDHLRPDEPQRGRHEEEHRGEDEVEAVGRDEVQQPPVGLERWTAPALSTPAAATAEHQPMPAAAHHDVQLS